MNLSVIKTRIGVSVISPSRCTPNPADQDPATPEVIVPNKWAAEWLDDVAGKRVRIVVRCTDWATIRANALAHKASPDKVELLESLYCSSSTEVADKSGEQYTLYIIGINEDNLGAA